MALPPQQRPLNCRLPGHVYHKIFETVGSASMCWRPKPSSEVFDSDLAAKFAVELGFCVADALDAARGRPYEPPAPDFINTETKQSVTLPPKDEAAESPEGPGRDGNKPLMGNRQANDAPSPIDNAGGNTLTPVVAKLLLSLRELHAELQECALTFKEEENDEAYCSTGACADRLREVVTQWLEETGKGKSTPVPASVVFFPNGTAGVCDQRGQQIPKYQTGNHDGTIAALREDGIDWRNLQVTGRPL